MDKIKAPPRFIVRRALISLLVIACGLTLRLTGYDIGLPYFLVKYGGSLLWGMMVFWLVGVLLPRQPVVVLATVSAAIAVLTEFTRLYHTPWLDQFRLELAGALLLGRIFSWGNIVAYLIGIILAALIERRVLEEKGTGKA